MTRLPFDPRASYVAATEWNVSFWHDVDGTVLHVRKCDDDAVNEYGGRGVEIRHPEHDGRYFPKADDAGRYAYEHGLLRMWRDRDGNLVATKETL